MRALLPTPVWVVILGLIAVYAFIHGDTRAGLGFLGLAAALSLLAWITAIQRRRRR
jgi:hypothetical protein